MTNSPLLVNIIDGSDDEDLTNRFVVKCEDTEKLKAFYEWWLDVGVVRLAETLAKGATFYLVDDGAGHATGSYQVFHSYMVWRGETFAELGRVPALAAA